MNGQWIGKYNDGVHDADIIVNLDDNGSNYRGSIFLFCPPNSDEENLTAQFYTNGKEAKQNIRIKEFHILHGKDYTMVDKEYRNSLYYSKAKFHPNSAEMQLSWTDPNFLELSWQTDVGTSGTAKVPRSKVDQPSDLNAKRMNWNQFKEYMSSLTGRRHLYRGQSQRWRLRTSFHRARRTDLVYFSVIDLPALNRRLSRFTKHLYNLDDAEQKAAFLNLVQHHGYPTPLIDWTYSPYVAAYFAFRDIVADLRVDSEQFARVLILDDWWDALHHDSFASIWYPRPRFSVSEFLAIDNERSIPQQSVSGFSNVDDIETFVKSLEVTDGRQYLTAIDIPFTERRTILKELAFMGVTAGSLFPGIDGTCEEMKQRNFFIS